MDAILVAVAVMSLALALAMGLASYFVLREQRRRSLARVAALVRASGVEGMADATSIASDTRSTRSARVSNTGCHADPSAPVSEPAARVLDKDTFGSSRPTAGAEHVLFGIERIDRPPIWTRRVAAMAAFGGLVTIGAGAALLPVGGLAPRIPETGSSARSNEPVIELISLQHEKQGELLSITGLVRIQSTDEHPRTITVVASVFDVGGSLVATGHATLAVVTAGARKVTPFGVNVPAAVEVSRYRVGFRTETGAVLPHINNRTVVTGGDSS